MAIVVQVLNTAVQREAVANTAAVQQGNAVHDLAIVVLVQNTVAAVVATILVATILVATILVSTILVEVAYAVPQVVQREHAVPHMDFVETLLPIAEELPITSVTIPVAVLVSAAHTMDIVPVLEPTVLPPSSCPERSHFHSKANSKAKRHIIMRPWPERTTAHVVQVGLFH
jgi:hypothetical protein